ncbi:MAG: regulatory protein [Gammaproteobacteria bacterium]|jgi:regulatory protein
MNQDDKPKRSARNAAMDYLARREHSILELTQKLSQKLYDDDAIGEAIESLQRDGLQSDERFSEHYARSRFNSGQGPFKIKHELRARGIPDELISECLGFYEDDWVNLMKQIRDRKFGGEIPDDPKQIMKQLRFLQNRGFSAESVMRLFR